MATSHAVEADPSNLLDNNDLEAGVIGIHQTDDITAMAQTLLMQPGGSPDDNQVPAEGDTAETQNAIVFRNAQQVAIRRLTAVTLVCLITMVPFIFAYFAVFLWSCVAISRDGDQECDVPIKQWFYVQAAIFMWHHGVQRLFVRIIFGFDSRLHSARQIPWGARLWLAVFYSSAFAWTICGVTWVSVSSRCEAKTTLESVSVLVWLSLSAFIGLVIYQLLFMYWAWAILNGRLPDPENGVPEGFMEQLPVIPYSDSFEDGTYPAECCICLAEFDTKQQIVSSGCHEKQHIFHKECVLGWFKSNRTCPLCRKDVVEDDHAELE